MTDVQATSVEPAALPLDGGLIRLRASGVHFPQRISLQFRHTSTSAIAGASDDAKSGAVLTAPATFERAQAQEAKRDPEQLVRGH